MQDIIYGIIITMKFIHSRKVKHTTCDDIKNIVKSLIFNLLSLTMIQYNYIEHSMNINTILYHHVVYIRYSRRRYINYLLSKLIQYLNNGKYYRYSCAILKWVSGARPIETQDCLQIAIYIYVYPFP